LRKAKDLEPGNVVVLSTLALCLDQSGRHEEAAQGYRDALAADPNNGANNNNLAYLIAERGGDLDVALVHAQRAKQAMPGSAEVNDTLGWIYLKRKQSDQAIAAFREAFEQKPGENVYRTHLAMALDQKGDASKEAEELKLLLRAAPSPENEARIRVLLQAVSGPRP
jgi:Flp pilus assembly protein TadD